MVANNNSIPRYRDTSWRGKEEWDIYKDVVAEYNNNPSFAAAVNKSAAENRAAAGNNTADTFIRNGVTKIAPNSPNNSAYRTAAPVVKNNLSNTATNTYADNYAFTPAETYKFRADGYYNQGNTALGDAYSALWKGSDAFANTAKQMNDFFDVYANDVWKRENALAGVKSQLADKLYNDMYQQRQYVYDMFGPNGSLTKEINKYYDDLGNYLSTDAGRQAAAIAAQGVHSGASLGAIRAQQNQAYNESFARYVQAKEQEINAKQQIAANLINYMSTLRQEYGDTTNTYIISQYQRANDLLNAISQSVAQSNIELNNAKLSNSLKGSGGGNGISFNPDHKVWTWFESNYLNTPEKRELWNMMTSAQQRAYYMNAIQAYAFPEATKDLTNGGETTGNDTKETTTTSRSSKT